MHNHPGVENHMGSLNSRKSTLIGKSLVDGASSMQLADGIYSNLTWQREIPTVAMEKNMPAMFIGFYMPIMFGFSL